VNGRIIYSVTEIGRFKFFLNICLYKMGPYRT